MHTYVSDNGTVFNFNSDMSGQVIIVRSTGSEEFRISVEDLIEFVAFNVILPNKIQKLENMDWEDLVNL